MDDLADIFKIFRFLAKLRNFREMSIWRKILTVFGGLGFIMSLFLFFWTPSSVAVEDFQLGSGHQVSYEACREFGADASHFGDVAVDVSCSCFARHWAHEFSADYQADIKPGLTYMFNHYDQIEWTHDSDIVKIDHNLAREYASKAGKLNMPERTPDMMREQMSKLTKVTETCTDSWSLTDESLTEMLALGLNGTVLTVPQNEADVVIALRGTSDIPSLSASN